MPFRAALPSAALLLLLGQIPALAQAPLPEREAMRHCVNTVSERLHRARASHEAVAPAVVTQCDRQLRAALAAAIRAGQAWGCTIESCLGMARQRAGGQATANYQRRMAIR